MTTIQSEFSGRVGIVSGGASGIGEGVCHGLGQRGAKVVVADINQEQAERVVHKLTSQGYHATPVIVDITDSEQVAAAVDSIMQQFGQIDYLVNCAGWASFVSPEDYTIEYWQRTRSINLDGTWHFCHSVAAPMRQQKHGKIVNIGSTASLLANPHQAPYSVAKHAVVGITRALAVDLGSYQINVNCVCPTTTETPLARVSTTEAFRQRMAEQIPLGRLAQVSDIVGAVLFLLSPAADFITGCILPVDGGLTCCRRAHHYEE